MSIFKWYKLCALLTMFLAQVFSLEYVNSCTNSYKQNVNDFLLKYNKLLENDGRRTHMNAINSRDKVRFLGKVLKCYITRLRAHVTSQVDLVFVIDSSTSVGHDNFLNEIRFVKKLLSDFTVDSNHTRVSVITFSNSDSVLRHVDHLQNGVNPRADHKCSLLDILHDVADNYVGGATYTIGGLVEAKVGTHFLVSPLYLSRFQEPRL